jgi:hypothetical protein
MLKLFRSKAKRINRAAYSQVTYTTSCGSFDYDKYRAIQQEGNKRKINKVWALRENIAFISRYIEVVGQPHFGICHGTRRGLEQTWFREELGCEVIGTEISDTAAEFPHTIQWDFHEVKPEWIGAADFVYSNSLDHAYNPGLALSRWMQCLKPSGICILEHSSEHEPAHSNELDPFGATLHIMPYLILKWGRGSFFATEIIDAPAKQSNTTYRAFIIVRRFAVA